MKRKRERKKMNQKLSWKEKKKLGDPRSTGCPQCQPFPGANGVKGHAQGPRNESTLAPTGVEPATL